MRGTVFSIEEFSVFDGPGIRTSVFLKGCPLRCAWCHNPEGQKSLPEIIRNPNGCLGCGRCETNAARENGRLVYTKASIKSCPKGLLRVCGEELCSEELVSRVLKNETILAANGGVTFSGGEPLMQVDLCVKIAKILKSKDINIAIDTCAAVPRSAIDKIIPFADTFLFDIKAIDKNVHIACTGVSNEQILENIRYVDSLGIPMEIRYPYVPGMNDGESEKIAYFVKELKSVKNAWSLPNHS